LPEPVFARITDHAGTLRLALVSPGIVVLVQEALEVTLGG
jgi:hypothetical protein